MRDTTTTTRAPIQIQTPSTVIVLADPCPACADSPEPGFRYDPLLDDLQRLYRAHYWKPGNANCTEHEQERAEKALAAVWQRADQLGYDAFDIDDGIGGRFLCQDCSGRGYLPTDALRAIRRALDLTGLANSQEG